MLETAKLRVLAAVAAHGSVTKAAAALHYSQPSVSHHLARLEAETGIRLVQRVGRGIRLTPEGELLAKRATEIVGRLEAAQAELADLAGLRTGRVRIAACSSALSELVPPAAVALHQAHPKLELELIDAHPAVAERLLREGDADLAIVHRYDDELPEDGLRYSHLLDDPMYLLSRRAGDTLDNHRDSDWIGGCQYCRADLIRICATAGFEPRIGYTSDDLVISQAFVAAGLGIQVTSGLALRSHHAKGVVATEIAGVHRRIHTATFGDPPDPPATAAFLAALRTTSTAAKSHRH